MKFPRIAAALAAASLATLGLSTPSQAGDYGRGYNIGNGIFQICRWSNRNDCALFQAADTFCYNDDLPLGLFLRRMGSMRGGFYYGSYPCGPGNTQAGVVQICIGDYQGSREVCTPAFWVKQ